MAGASGQGGPQEGNVVNIDAFIERWQHNEGGAERANFPLFLTELAQVLDLPQPDPADATHDHNDYVFERAVTFRDEKGKTGHGRIDLYKRGCFVLEAKQSRERGGAKEVTMAAQIIAPLPNMAKDMPLVLAGEMNARPDSKAYATFSDALTDAREAAEVSEGPDNSFHDFTGTADRRINYIFVRGFDVLIDTTDTFHQGKVYPSDHLPVVAKQRFNAWDGAGM